MIVSRDGIAQIFPISSLLHYFDKSYPYYVTHSLETANNELVPVTLMPYSTNSSNTSLSNNTIILQTTRTTILPNLSDSTLNITSELIKTSTSLKGNSNFKTQENTLITSSSNNQPVTAEPWTRKYEDVFGNYGLKPAPSRISPKVKKIKSKYDQVAFVYPPPPSFPHPVVHQSPIPHSSHPARPNHYLVMKPYDTSGEEHKLDLNPLVPPSNELTIDYYVTSSSPTFFEEPDISYYPPGVEPIHPSDSELLHTKKHYSKHIHRPSPTPLPSPTQMPHPYHPYPFYNQQQIYKPTPTYPPVKKFIATVRPILASPPPPPGHSHTTHIIKYTTSNPRYRVLPTLVEPIVDQPVILGPTKSTPPHDLFVPPRIQPQYYQDYYHPYSSPGPYTISDLVQNRNLLKQFNNFVNQKEKRKRKIKNKKKKNEDEYYDEQATKKDYDTQEYDERGDKEEEDDDEDDDAEDNEYPRKRKLKNSRNRHRNNKYGESKLENTRIYPRHNHNMKKYLKEPFTYSDEAFDKNIHGSYPSIPKNHKLEQMQYGSWEKKGFAGESLEMEKPLNDFKTLGSNRVDVKQVSCHLS